MNVALVFIADYKLADEITISVFVEGTDRCPLLAHGLLFFDITWNEKRLA